MKADSVETYFKDLQDEIYYKLNTFSKSNKIAGRFCSIPISILDVGLETLKIPLSAIEHIARAAINLIGAAFFKDYTLKNALLLTELAVGLIALTPAKLVLAPINIVYQLFAIIINPEKVESIAHLSFEPELNNSADAHREI